MTKLLASDGASGDTFGGSVAVSGDTVVVGAYRDDDNGNTSGSAYVFERDEGGADAWGEVKKLLASDGASRDEFGFSVAVSGDTAVIGAWLDDDNGSASGSAYVFELDSAGPLTSHLVCLTLGTLFNARAEGQAELMGDITYICESSDVGLPAPASFVDVNLLVQLSVPVTNNIGFGEGGDITDAVLIVNQNDCNTPSAVGNDHGCGGAYQDPQYGRLLGDGRTIAFNGVSLPFPGGANASAPGGVNPDITRIRITSMRGNASYLGVPQEGRPSLISAHLEAQPPTSIVLSRDRVAVAFAWRSLIRISEEPVQGLHCVDDGPQIATLTFREGFASAFKTIGVPSDGVGFAGFWESGYWAPGSNNNAGASQATQFLVSFSDIPDGVTVKARKSYSNGDRLLLTLLGETCGDISELELAPDSEGNTELVYEVCDTNPIAREDIEMGFTTEWDPENPPAFGEATLGVSFHPIGGSGVTSAEDPEPRFVDTSDSETFLIMQRCITTLHFPLVTDRGKDSARIVISNDSDPALPGVCELTYEGTDEIGDPVQSFQTSAPVPGGEQLNIDLAEGAPALGITGLPGFEGALTAFCEFHPGAGISTTKSMGVGMFEAFSENRDALLFPGAPIPSTMLLFPYASNRNNLDTEIVIHNPGLLGADDAEDVGSCALQFFGENPPGPMVIGPFNEGEQVVLTLSEVAPNFEGYVAASCDFGPSGFARLSLPAIGGMNPVPLYAYGLTPSYVDSDDGASSSALLLPWISSRDGLETELVISNASANPFGDIPQNGSCTLTYQGDAQSPVLPPQNVLIGTGQQVVFDLSEGLPLSITGAPDFEGSIGVSCDFPRPFGYALTSKAKGNNNNPNKESTLSQAAETVMLPRSIDPEPVVYPFVSNRDGANRGIVLVNTTGDAFGTVGTDGSCTLSYAGTIEDGGTVPADADIALVAGEAVRFNLSEGLVSKGIPAAPGFEGFLKADCDFPLARGTDYRIQLGGRDK